MEKVHYTIAEKIKVISNGAEEVDWHQQWEDFAPDFYDGLAHIDLGPFGGSELLLKPGAGFGDLSHPTTRLMITMMAPLIKDKIVFDIGCGSGILAIAAILLGAKKAYGIDIERGAIEHSQENAKLNGIKEKAQFSREIEPSRIPNEPLIVMMNMIECEQRIAWDSLPSLHSKKALIITSGILSSQKKIILSLQKAGTGHWKMKIGKKNGQLLYLEEIENSIRSQIRAFFVGFGFLAKRVLQFPL